MMLVGHGPGLKLWILKRDDSWGIERHIRIKITITHFLHSILILSIKFLINVANSYILLVHNSFWYYSKVYRYVVLVTKPSRFRLLLSIDKS